jgi:hypothetical protein
MRSPQIIRVLRFAVLRSSWVHVNCCFQVPGLLDEQREGDVGELFSLAQWSNSGCVWFDFMLWLLPP